VAKKPSPLLPIFLIVLIDVLGLTIVLPLLPFYAEAYGASPQTVGLLTTVFALCQLVSGPLLGALSDRTGRKPLLLVSQAGTLVGFIMLAMATSLPMVFLSRVIDGVTAGNLSLAQAYVSDVTRPEDRSKSFALIGIAFGIGFFVGPATSAMLGKHSIQAPIYVACALSALSILATTFLLPANPPRPEGEAEGPPSPGGKRLGLLQWGGYVTYMKRPVLGGLLLQFFLFQFGFSTFTSGFSLFAERRFTWDGHAFGVREVGFLFAYAGFLGIVLQGGLIGRLVKRLGEPALTTAGFVTMMAGYLLLGLAHDWRWLLGITAISSFGTGVLRPVLTSMVSQSVPRSEQGMVLGLAQSLTSLAAILAPILGGFLIEQRELLGWAVVAAASGGLGLLAVRWGSGAFSAAVRPTPG
jgi:MFS family permease